MLKLKDLLESHHDRNEGKMAKHDAMECASDSKDVSKMIQDEMNLPEWLEAKITKAADYMNSVKDYLTHHMTGGDEMEESLKELASPFSQHLRDAQDEIEYMIKQGPEPDGDDSVYKNPGQAMKLLQLAQKSLGKIK